jgi:hypothetical protein
MKGGVAGLSDRRRQSHYQHRQTVRAKTGRTAYVSIIVSIDYVHENDVVLLESKFRPTKCLHF